MYFIAFIIKIKESEIKKIKLKESYPLEKAELIAQAKANYYNKLYNPLSINVNLIDIKNLEIIKLTFDENKNIKKEIKSYKTDYKRMIEKIKGNKDYQQNLVYKWEDDNFSKYGFFKELYDKEKMSIYINKVLDSENVPRIKINFLNKGRASFFKWDYLNPDNHTLNFLEKSLNNFFALHELTHYIVYYKNLPDEGHGKYFVGIYAYLLIKYIKINKEKIYKSLASYNINFIDYKTAEIIMKN